MLGHGLREVVIIEGVAGIARSPAPLPPDPQPPRPPGQTEQIREEEREGREDALVAETHGVAHDSARGPAHEHRVFLRILHLLRISEAKLQKFKKDKS